MKLFLIKLGKLYKSVKKNGIIPGIRMALSYGIIYLKNIFVVKRGDILFVTGGVGDSAMYRTINQAEELTLHGFHCSVTIIDHPFLVSLAKKFRIFILNRPLYTSKVAAFIQEIKKQNKEIIFDTDDLVFDADLFHLTDSYKKMNVFEKKQYEKGIGSEIINDPYVRVLTTSTAYLSALLQKFGKKIFITKDRISNHELELSSSILKNKKTADDLVRIGYFSGTYSHNKDFASITDALIKILEKYPQTRLYLAGPLDKDNQLNKYKNQIVTLPFVPRDSYYKNLNNVDINLAPLIKGDPFCESKFEIKFMEPGLLKIPTVAVRNGTFSQAIEDGVDGFLAENTTEWMEKISRLIEKEDLRKAMGEKAREKVLRDYTNKNSHNEEYYNYLRSKL
ncbi:MAG TPA: glycosyltransferase [Patescibacteria group bacterium]|nr:glycosyltransferase [Patescibacteria group bacterium]